MKDASGIRRLFAVLFWVLVWQIAALLIRNRIILVSPAEALQRLFALMGTKRFYLSLAASAGRVMLGFFLALALAAPLACLAEKNGAVRLLLSPAVKTMRAIPVASFVILALILFSSRLLSILIAFTVAFPVLYTALLDALAARSRDLHEMARVFRVPVSRRFRYLDAFELLPRLATACRLAVGMAWKAGIAAELIGIPRLSVGEHLQQAKTYLDMADLFAWTAAVIAASAACERLILFGLERLRDRALRF